MTDFMSLPERTKLPHTPPPWVDDGAIFFITLCLKQRGGWVLCQTPTPESLFASIDFNRTRGIWWPHLVLLMPDHLHGLFTFGPDPGIKKAMGDWKHYTSRTFNLDWQRDFFDHRLRSHDEYVEKAAYIRQNPVRAGLVARAEDWPHVREWPTVKTENRN